MKHLRLAFLIGIAISALLLAVLVARMDWVEFAAAFRRMDVAFLLGAASTVVLSILLRTFRWQLLANIPLRQYVSVWYAEVVGYVGNLIYPGRAGEVLRVAAIHHLAHVEPGRAIASAFVDRLGDIVVLALAAVAVAMFVVGLPRGIVIAAVATAGAAIGALGVFLAFARRSTPFVERFARRVPRPLATRLTRWYAQAVDAAHLLRRPGILVASLGLSLVASSCDYALIWLVIKAMGWSLPLAAAVATGVYIALGTLLPAAPGYVGVYQLACVLALGPFGVSESAALAYSIVLQVTVLLVIGVLGLAAFARYGWVLRAS